MAYLLSGEIEFNSSISPDFINGIWWSKEKIEVLFEPADSQVICPSDMQKVEGQMLDDGGLGSWHPGSVEFLQKKTCSAWIEKKFPERCETYDSAAWKKLSVKFGKKSMSFCIDKYEWPNRKGLYPWVMVTWVEAQDLCWSVGKRLCSEEEWTFACEGEEATPYPYGYKRNSEECNLDKPWRQYSSAALAARGSKQCARELDRLWQGHRSGSSPNCASSFGVEDMNGSVDEWTSKTLRHGEYPSILKGGYWSRVRNRCRPSTRNHGPGHTFYQQGFRCCKNLNVVENVEP